MEASPHHHPRGQPRPSPEARSFLERLGAWRNAAGGALGASPPHAGPSRVKRVVIPVTRKGGVGKTFFLTALADWLSDLRIPFVAMDADFCNGSLTRFVPEARFLDVAGANPTEHVQEALSDHNMVLIDGLGSLQAYVLDWLKDSNFLGDFGVPVALTYVLLVEEDKDSVFQAGEALRALASTGSWLVVRNLKTCPTTEIYNTSDARQALLRQGAVEIQMDRIPWNLLLQLQRSGRTLRALAEDSSLPFLERQRLKSYLNKLYEQLGLAQSILLPEGIERHSPSAPFPTASTSTAEKSTGRGRPRIAPKRV